MSPIIWNQSTQLVRTCCGLASCPRMGSSGQRVRPLLLAGLPFVCAFRRREWTLMCPCAGADGSPWRKLRHWTFATCMAQQRAAFVGRGQELLFQRKHLKQNRSVSSTRLRSQAYAWRLARVWCKDLYCRQGSLIRTVGPGRFFQHSNKFRLSLISERLVADIPVSRTLDRTHWLFVLSRC